MPSNAFQLGKLLISSGEVKISPENVSDDFSTIEQVSSTDALSASGNAVGDQRLVGSNLYIWNGTGWYRIALINQTPTWDSGGQPSASYILDADSPQDATVITLAASDPDGLSITYSYVTGGSMDSMATISQDSSVFTIAPKTVSEVGEGVELTGSITFRASDGVNILPSVSSFTLSFITIIENSRYTTLLATATGTSDNNNITDSSTNNHTITVAGDAHAGTFSPYNDSYSAYMDGGDLYYLSSSADWNLGSSWTIEGWFYPTAQPTEHCRLFMFGTNGGSAAMGIGLNTDMTWGGGGAFGNGAMFTLPQGYLNQWQHVAWVRDGNSNTGTIYVNGVASAGSYSGPAVQAAGNVDLKIGYDTVASVAYQYRGYFADIRITKSAVYTANFTPATERLTSSDVLTDTKLLAFNKPYLKDQSTSNHNISISAGNPRFKVFAPFDRLEYLSSNNGGSIYFDGTDDALEISDNADFDLSGGSWTIECWWYPLVVNTYDGIFNQWNGATAASGRNINVTWESNRLYLFGYDGGTFISSIYHDVTAAQLQNSWNHVAAVFDGTKTELYLNGEASGRAYVSSNNLSKDVASEPFRVAKHHRLTSYYYNNSYVSDLRLVKGTAVYSGAFTPPTGPLTTTGGTYPSTTNVNTSITAGHTKLHIKGTAASIIDKSQGSNLKLVGNTTGSTTQVKFTDTKSMYFDGAGDYITADQIPLGTGNFTIEAYTYLDARLTSYPAIFSNYSTFSAGSLSLFAGHGSSTTTNYQVAHNGAGFPAINGGPITYDQWVHLCVERYNGTITLYKDGSSVGSFSSAVALNGVGSNFYIGASGDSLSTSYINGWIQDFRVTTGLARYTTNFTPPTAPLKG